MLQRIQTIWLLLATVLGISSLKASFYVGSRIKDTITLAPETVTASYNIMLMVATIATATLAFLAIFLFKNRKLQLRVVVVSLLLSLGTLLLYYWQSKSFTGIGGTFTITAIIPISIPVLLILAIRGISNDNKLIKSLERLR